MTELQALIEQQTNPTIAPYAKPNEVTLRITAKVTNAQTGKQLLDELEKRLLLRLATISMAMAMIIA